MEKMWSPWRSVYIESFSDKNKDTGCVFCNALKQDAASDDSLVVYKGSLTITVLNLFPYNNGHLMVIPKRHISSFEELTAEEHIEVMEMINLNIRALKLVHHPEGFNIGANLGKAAGAGIDSHLHFHIVPRWNGDTNFMPVLGEVKVVSQDLLATKRKLTGAYPELTKK